MDSNKRVQSFLTPTAINGYNGIWSTEGLLHSCPESYPHPFHSIFTALNITSESESESDSEVDIVTKPEVKPIAKTLEVKRLEAKTLEANTRTIGTQYSINDFEDWILVKDKNS